MSTVRAPLPSQNPAAQSAEIQIRMATQEDVTAIAELTYHTFKATFVDPQTKIGFFPEQDLQGMAAAIRSSYPNDLKDPRYQILIATKAGQLLGFAKVNLEPDCAFLDKLYVSTAAQGSGVGNLLMLGCIEFALKNNKTVMRLDVWDQNQVAISYYQKNQFIITDKRHTKTNSLNQPSFGFEMICKDLKSAHQSLSKHIQAKNSDEKKAQEKDSIRDEKRELLKRVPDLDGLWNILNQGFLTKAPGSMNPQEYQMMKELIEEEKARRAPMNQFKVDLEANILAELKKIPGYKDYPYLRSMAQEIRVAVLDKLAKASVSEQAMEVLSQEIQTSILVGLLKFTDGPLGRLNDFSTAMANRVYGVVKSSLEEFQKTVKAAAPKL